MQSDCAQNPYSAIDKGRAFSTKKLKNAIQSFKRSRPLDLSHCRIIKCGRAEISHFVGRVRLAHDGLSDVDNFVRLIPETVDSEQLQRVEFKCQF